MESRRSLRSLVPMLAALPFLLGGLPGSDREQPSAELPARAGTSVSEAPAGASVAASRDATELIDGSLGALQRHIEQREYQASAGSNGLQAPNRAHNLRTYFAPTGIRVHDRTQPGSPELLALNLAGVGRGERPTRIGPGEVASEGVRVEIRRPGIIEWFENSAAGLEQGVTLIEKPGGEGPLVVELSVRGARAALHGDRVRFTTPTGRQLSYAKLAALDARDRALEAHFELPEPSRLRLVVDDAEAVYPVVIDPLLTGVADSQIEPDQIYTNLGVSVAGAGDVNGDGYADVVVGAHRYDAGETDEGAAFVFHGSVDGIVANGNPAVADAQLESDQANAWLGWSVAGAGDVNDDGYADVIVGAYRYGSNALIFNPGAAFVFHGSAGGIVANGNPANANATLAWQEHDAWLGYSVAGAGDINGDGYADVIVGAPDFDQNPSSRPQDTDNAGAVYIFLGSAGGISSGSPFVVADTQLLGVRTQRGSVFGHSVAGAGDVNGDGYADVIIGSAYFETLAGGVAAGAAYVFHGSVAGIFNGGPNTATTQILSTQMDAYLGSSVAGAGDVNGDGYADVIVGAVRYDAGETDEGAAFVYLGGAAGIPDGDPSTAASQLESDQEGAKLGRSVASAGDINGDGYADVIVGAYRYETIENEEGAAFVFLGSAGGIVANGSPANADVRLESNQEWAWLGWSVAGAGDVNDDGVDDVIVGAAIYDGGQLDEGAAFVYLSDPTLGTAPEPTLVGGLAAGVACLAMFARLRQRANRAA